MTRRFPLRLVLLVLLVGSTPVFANETGGVGECDFAALPVEASLDGEVLVRGLSSDLAGELFSKGRVEPPPGVIPAPVCPGLIQILVIFDPPRDEVMALLEATDRQGEYLPDLDRVATVMHAEHESIVQHERKILFTRFRYRLHNHTIPEASRIWWELSSAFENDFTDIRGYWQFYDLEQTRTLAVYATRVVVGPALPQSMQDSLTRNSLRKSIKAIRAWVNTEGRSKP